MEDAFSGQSVLEGTTRYDGSGPPSAMLRGTGPLSASCDRTEQTGNWKHAQTRVEQRIAALASLAKAALLLSRGLALRGRRRIWSLRSQIQKQSHERAGQIDHEFNLDGGEPLSVFHSVVLVNRVRAKE